MKIVIKSLFILITLYYSCANIHTTDIFLNKSSFSINLPLDCSNKKTEYLDSEYGEYKCKKFTVSYDYGFCNYSNYVAYSMNDYLHQNRWLINAIPKLIPIGEEVAMDTIFDRIKVLDVDNESLIGKFEYGGDIFEHNIQIPAHLSDLVEKADTISGVVTRIIFDKDFKSISCYKINTLNFSSEQGCPESLIVRVISQDNLDTAQVFNIFNSINFPKKN